MDRPIGRVFQNNLFCEGRRRRHDGDREFFGDGTYIHKTMTDQVRSDARGRGRRSPTTIVLGCFSVVAITVRRLPAPAPHSAPVRKWGLERLASDPRPGPAATRAYFVGARPAAQSLPRACPELCPELGIVNTAANTNECFVPTTLANGGMPCESIQVVVVAQTSVLRRWPCDWIPLHVLPQVSWDLGSFFKALCV